MQELRPHTSRNDALVEQSDHAKLTCSTKQHNSNDTDCIVDATGLSLAVSGKAGLPATQGLLHGCPLDLAQLVTPSASLICQPGFDPPCHHLQALINPSELAR